MPHRLQHLEGYRGTENRLDIFFINQSIFRCKQRCVKYYIRAKSTALCFIPVKRPSIDKNAASFGQLYPVVPGKTDRRAFLNKQDFQFVVPMPVNPMKIKLPNIFRIIREGYAWLP